MHDLKGSGVAPKTTEKPIYSGTAAGKSSLDNLCVFAEFGTNFRKVRQAEGIQVAKEGVYKGGKRRIDPEAVRQLAPVGVMPAHIARQLGIARMAYRLCLQARAGPCETRASG